MSISSLESFSDLEEKSNRNNYKKSLNNQNNNTKTNKIERQHDPIWDFINSNLNNASKRKRKDDESNNNNNIKNKNNLNNLSKIVSSYNATN